MAVVATVLLFVGTGALDWSWLGRTATDEFEMAAVEGWTVHYEFALLFNGSIEGSWTVFGGHEITFAIMTKEQYDRWWAGEASESVYGYAGWIHRFNVSLPPGDYRIVFWYAGGSDAADVTFSYRLAGWDPPYFIAAIVLIPGGLAACAFSYRAHKRERVALLSQVPGPTVGAYGPVLGTQPGLQPINEAAAQPSEPFTPPPKPPKMWP
jgi:hypothetical protein